MRESESGKAFQRVEATFKEKMGMRVLDCFKFGGIKLVFHMSKRSLMIKFSGVGHP